MLLNFEDVCGSTINQPFYRPREMEEVADDDLDEGLHHPEKKRRLTANQVQFLEKSFEVENKLDPERKIQLAKDLDLQPRQVAIWFQNRRARWKTKQLEKDYETLKSSYNALKADYDSLIKEKDKLKAEVYNFALPVFAILFSSFDCFKLYGAIEAIRSSSMNAFLPCDICV